MMARKPARPRSVRVPDELWDAAKDEADRRNETVTDVILRALRRYVSHSPRTKEDQK